MDRGVIENSSIKMYGSLAGKSHMMRRIYDLVDVVSTVNIGIHITGEDGSGKDMLAEYIHIKSNRKGEFITLNPVLLNDIIGSSTSLEVVYEYFLKALDGTVYISSISSASLILQESLYSAVKKIENEYGLRAPRFISSTNKNLGELSNQNKFSNKLRDVFSIIINVPPLRERREDILELAKIFIKEHSCGEHDKFSIHSDVHDIFLSYDWPGNIRQLSNVIYYSLNHAVNGEIQVSSLPKEVSTHGGMSIMAHKNTLDELYKYASGLLESGSHSDLISPYDEYLKMIEVPLIQAALDMSKGNRSQAAKLLNINRNTLHKKIKMYNLEDKKEV